MQRPVIHLNGTSRAELVRQRLAIVQAYDSLLDVLARNSPNQRDYYPAGEAAWRAARDEHAAEYRRLREARDEHMKLAEEIAP
jgi:hypothetical protein